MSTLTSYFQGTNQRPNLRKHKPSDQLPLDELVANHFRRKCTAPEAPHSADDGPPVEGETTTASSTAATPGA